MLKLSHYGTNSAVKVQALKSIKDRYYPLEEGEVYDVHAIVYFATPFFSDVPPTELDNKELRQFVNPMYSYGVTRNELVYLLKAKTATGRLTLVRYNTANFVVVDPAIPDGWSTSVIDLYAETAKIKTLFEKHDNDEATQFSKPLDLLKSYGAKIIVTGDTKLHSFDYLQSVCDDDVDDE